MGKQLNLPRVLTNLTVDVSIDAHSWTPLTGTSPPLLFINPPFHQLGHVWRKILADRPDWILVLPL